MRSSLPCLLVLLTAASWPGRAHAAPEPEPDPEPGVAEVRECAERNLPERSARQRLVLERFVGGESERRFEATLLWKRGAGDLSRVRVTVDAPPNERGTAFLMIEREGEDDMFSYLPALRSVRRITTRAIAGSFLGTDLSYEDFQLLHGFQDDAKTSRLPDGVIGERPVYVLESVAAEGADSSYERVRAFFDRETCVLLRAELSGPRAEREIEVAWPDVERVGERWVPRLLTLRDRKKGSETRLAILETEWDVALRDELLTESGLARGR